jgi:cytochrome c-type biogenesis protein CcmH
MLAFWSVVTLLTAAALLFVLPPLVRRESSGATGVNADRLSLAVHREQLAELDAALAQGRLSAADHAAERAQIERRVAEDLPAADAAGVQPMAPGAGRREAWIVGLALPAAALAIYALLGQPRTVQPDAAPAAAATASSPHTLTPEQMSAMVDRLAEKLKSNPSDADGWHMLARSYVSFGRIADAAAAYDKAVALTRNDPNLLADYADVLAMVNGRNLDGRPFQLVQAALQIDPAHQKALSLAGTASFNRKDFAAAIDFWQRLYRSLPPQSDAAQRVASSIAQAQSAMGAGGGDAGTTSPDAGRAAAGPERITGEVRLAESLRSRLAPGATLYVFARAVEGPRMPLSIARSAAGPFPARFALDDSSAMSPQTRLSSQSQVALGARVSASGSATPQSGDLLGTLAPVKVGSRDVVVVIDGVVP